MVGEIEGGEEVVNDDIVLYNVFFCCIDVNDGDTLHLVKGGQASSATTTASSSTSATSAASGSTTAGAPGTGAGGAFPFANPGALPNFGNMGNMLGGGDLNSMQQQLMNNPQMMQQMLNSPMMQGMFDNPELLSQMMLNNPQIQQMLDANPHVRHVLNDPAVSIVHHYEVFQCLICQ